MSLRPDDARARRRPPGGADRLASVLWAGLRFTEQAQVTGVRNDDAPSPSLTNPPLEPPPSQTRKRKAQESTNTARGDRRKLPCPPELRYKDGEILNADSRARIMGASSEFRSTPLPIIPLDGEGPRTQDELIEFISAFDVKTEVQTVLLELYRKVGPTTEQSLPVPKPGKAYASAYGFNTHKAQYYTQTLKADATVVHVVSGGEFWNEAQSGDRDGPGKLRTCHKGRLAYTTGMLWCNTSPNWQWKTRGDTAIRCRIHLPAGTQVIVDRSPVFGNVNHCEFGDPEGRKSQFPDVLLLPGEFEITDVKRYKNDDYASDDDDEDNPTQKDEIQPTPVAGQGYVPGTEMADEVYASRMLHTVDNFLDVRLEVTRMMRVPDETKSDFAFNH